MVPMGVRCKLYFDIDISAKDCVPDDFKRLSSNPKRILDDFHRFASHYLKRCVADKEAIRMLVLSGTRKDKVSFHIIYNVMFPNIHAVYKPVDLIVERSKEYETKESAKSLLFKRFLTYRKKGDGITLHSVADKGCYHSNQNFRTWGSSKYSSSGGVKLSLYRYGSTLYDKQLSPEPTLELFQQSLLTIQTPFDMLADVDKLRVIHAKTVTAPDEGTDRIEHSHHNYADSAGNDIGYTSPGPSNTRPGKDKNVLKVSPEVRRKIMATLKRLDYTVVKEWIEYARFNAMIVSENKPCLIAGRRHSTTKPYFVYEKDSDGIYQKCHSKECANERYHIPFDEE
ncbi:hypothetical protein HDU96_001796 [Phlyctochytrium bullatum]|nr:hypothetical protein HDU96_001796 [Phlyctochytrium bullatum]